MKNLLILMTILVYLFSFGTSMYVKQDDSTPQEEPTVNPFETTNDPDVSTSETSISADDFEQLETVIDQSDKDTQRSDTDSLWADADDTEPEIILDARKTEIIDLEQPEAVTEHSDTENAQTDTDNERAGTDNEQVDTYNERAGTGNKQADTDNERARTDNEQAATNNERADTGTTDDEDEPEIIVDVWTTEVIDNLVNRSEELESLMENQRRKRQTSCGKTGVLKIQAFYDDNFNNRFGANAVDRIQTIFTQMGKLLSLPTFSIELNDGKVIDRMHIELVGISYRSGIQHTATKSALMQFCKTLPNNKAIHHNMLFSSQGDQEGTVGIAWFRSLCYSRAKYRASVVEYYRNDIVTAAVAVHELAHTLGARHDFLANRRTRYDSTGRPCSGVDSIMDYTGGLNTWSTCSNEDFAVYLNQVRRKSLCFQLEDSCSSTSTV